MTFWRADAAPATADQAFRRLTWISAAILFSLGSLGLIYWFRQPLGLPETHFFAHHDGWILWAMPLAILALSPLAKAVPFNGDRVLRPQSVWLAAAAVFAVGLAGVWLVFENYTLSLDEVMANFDATIFGAGHTMARVPDDWLPFAEALNPKFVLQTEGHRFVASAYLPVNALLRAGGAALHAQPLVNPLLAAIAVVMTYAVGRQLWPQNPRRAIAAALILATSSQFLVMSMTAYAMTAHLAFNMVWLWLFLKNRRWADALAILVGAAACGLHQVVFHPFFVGPFILELLITRRWARAGTFILAYGVIGLFWISYWNFAFQMAGATPATTHSAGGSYFANQIAFFLSRAGPGNFGLMAVNLVRFVTWQNLLLTPLLLVGGLMAFKQGGPLRPMALGMVLVPVLLTIVLPTQVHGWGYRYLHGFLGSASLLAVAGWGVITAGLDQAQRRLANRGFVAASLLSIGILFPLQAAEARGFSHPLAASYRAIAERKEDFVLVDNITVGFDSGSMVRNDPFLRNRPKVLLLITLSPEDLDVLCRRGHAWIFDGRNPAARGIVNFDFEDEVIEKMAQLRAHLKAIGCVD
jgi:hypothetical protein